MKYSRYSRSLKGYGSCIRKLLPTADSKQLTDFLNYNVIILKTMTNVF